MFFGFSNWEINFGLFVKTGKTSEIFPEFTKTITIYHVYWALDYIFCNDTKIQKN